MPSLEKVLVVVKRSYYSCLKKRAELDMQLRQINLEGFNDLPINNLLFKVDELCKAYEELGSLRRFVSSFRVLGPHGRVALLSAKGSGLPQDELSPDDLG